MRIDRDAFAQAPDISIDYAVMEKSHNVVCVPLDAGWSDVGCWQSYWELSEKDASGNSFVGDAIDVGSKNTLVFSQDSGHDRCRQSDGDQHPGRGVGGQ